MITDFRLYPFSLERIESSGKQIGRITFWKLHLIENSLRTIINTILHKQLGINWWNIAVDVSIQKRAEDFRKEYMKKKWNTLPGTHPIYYVFISHLNEIMRANKNLFIKKIPDIDQWILRVEEIRLPRNIVAHMNCPSSIDIRIIDKLYTDISELVDKIGDELNEKRDKLLIP